MDLQPTNPDPTQPVSLPIQGIPVPHVQGREQHIHQHQNKQCPPGRSEALFWWGCPTFPLTIGKLEEKNTCFKGMFAGEFSIQSYFTHFVSISAKLSRQASPWFCSSLFYHIIAYHERASASHPATGPNCSLVRCFKSSCPWPLRRLGVRRNSITSAWWWWCWMPPPFQTLGIRACPFPSWRRLQNAEVLALIRRLACCKIVLRSRQEQFCEDQHLKLSRHIKTTLLPRLLYLQNLSVLLLFWLSSNQFPVAKALTPICEGSGVPGSYVRMSSSSTYIFSHFSAYENGFHQSFRSSTWLKRMISWPGSTDLSLEKPLCTMRPLHSISASTCFPRGFYHLPWRGFPILSIDLVLGIFANVQEAQDLKSCTQTFRGMSWCIAIR